MLTRYTATVLNGSKNPCRSAVVSDITNAILKKHASEGDSHSPGAGATYWDRKEQEKQLIAAYDKWAAKGPIWSMGSEKVKKCPLISSFCR